MYKKFLIFVSLCVLIVSSVSFLFVGSAVAASDSYPSLASGDACPSNCSPKPPSGAIRMQIGIPGVTDSCTYSGKTCHYVDGNLPMYIKNIYNFSVGLIAIIAVLMIMINGLKWVFAAGNPGTIKTAQDGIVSAISGLILILCSYVILYTINPNLTNLQLTVPNPVGTLHLEGEMCSKMSGAEIFYTGTHFNRNLTINNEGKAVVPGTDVEYELICGKDFSILENGVKSEKRCWGSECVGSEEGWPCMQMIPGQYRCVETYWAGSLSVQKSWFLEEVALVAIAKDKKNHKVVALNEIDKDNASSLISYSSGSEANRDLEITERGALGAIKGITIFKKGTFESTHNSPDFFGYALYIRVNRSWASDDHYLVDKNCNVISFGDKETEIFQIMKNATSTGNILEQFDGEKLFHNCSLNITEANFPKQ